MADTVSNNPAFMAPPPKAAKEAFDERPRVDDARVTAISKTDQAADARDSDQPSDAEIQRLAVESLKNSRLRIERDGEKGEFVYLMVDEDTGETVRRWPPETHKDLMAYLRSPQAGLIDKLA